MKKPLAFILAVVLLVSVIGTVIADCKHSWFTVSTNSNITNCNIVFETYNCPYCVIPHKHIRYQKVTTTRTTLCTLCHEVKTTTPTTYKERCTIR